MDDPSLYFLCVWAFAQLFALDCACGALLRHLAAITAILNLTLMPLLAVVPSFQSISPIIVVMTLLMLSQCFAMHRARHPADGVNNTLACWLFAFALSGYGLLVLLLWPPFARFCGYE